MSKKTGLPFLSAVRSLRLRFFIPLCVLCASSVSSQERLFDDVTDRVGLGSDVLGTSVARCLFVDLNGDHRPDVVVQSPLAPPSRRAEVFEGSARFPRVFLNTPDEESDLGFRFEEVDPSRLPVLYAGDGLVFADLDNDGHRDAIVTRYIDKNNPKWSDHGQRTAWMPGRGDGTFGETRIFVNATAATTVGIAVGDVDRDGMLDLALGNWYTEYGTTLEAYPNDLLTRRGSREFVLTQLPQELPAEFDSSTDLGGRPTYGMMIAKLSVFDRPQILELNYGRRWNRLWTWRPPRRSRPDLVWGDAAPGVGFDGDEIRHGRYPEWLKERAKTDPRFDRPDEEPFRANGNTFDCAVGDIDHDGDFDVFISEITHGWAGESSDRSRFLVRGDNGKFTSPEKLNVDRIPEGENNWNQGDLFCELADFDNNGSLELLLSSGDYPDNQRLRLFMQGSDNTFKDVTEIVQLDHDGSQMISVGDVNGDGALDILVGQTFNRYSAEQRAGRDPQLRLFMNRLSSLPRGEGAGVREGGRSLELYLEGDPNLGVNRDALGTIVAIQAGRLQQARQLIGIGGHAGKQQEFLVHFGVGAAETIEHMTVIWPGNRSHGNETQKFENVAPGRYTLRQGGELVPLE